MEVSGTSNFRVLGNGKKGRKLVYIKKKIKPGIISYIPNYWG